MNPLSWLRVRVGDFHPANFWAGITLSVYAIFGGLPLYLAVISQLGLNDKESASFILGVYGTSGVFSVLVAFYYRRPFVITTTLPPVLLLGALADRFTFAEMVGANIVASALIIVFGVSGVGRRVIAWIPLPIVMGMFGGSILGFVSRMVQASADDTIIAGAAIGGYLAGRVIQRTAFPPIAIALIAGGVAVAATQDATVGALSWTLPSFGVPDITFAPAAILAITPPLLVLSMVLGNIEGISFLRAQGYSVPVNRLTVLSGIHSLTNALLGAPPASVGRVAAAILAGPDAGPPESRYWGVAVVSVAWLPVVVGAGVVASLLGVLPASYVVTMGGLAVLGSLHSAFERAFGGELRFGALVALIVASTPFIAGGLPGAFWAIPAGIVFSLATERKELMNHWRPATQSDVAA